VVRKKVAAKYSARIKRSKMPMNKIKTILEAEKLIKKGNVSAATEQYVEYIRQNPQDVTALNALGDLYIRTGKIEDAVQEFLTVADLYDRKNAASLAVAMLKKVLKWSPQNEEATAKLADLYARQAKRKEACELVLDAALHYEKFGKRQTALEFYEQARKLNPSDARTQMKIGEIYTDLGKNWLAVEAFTKAAEIFEAEKQSTESLGTNIRILTIYPENLQALKAVTQLYLTEGQADSAITWIRKGLAQRPTNAEIQLLLVRAYLSCANLDEAEQILSAIPKDFSERSHLALEIGGRYLAEGALDRAVDCGKRALESLSAKSAAEDAIGLFQKVLEIDNQHVGALEGLAEIFRGCGDAYNLMVTLTALFDAAVDREENSVAEKALEELVSLQTPESKNPAAVSEAKRPLPEVRTNKSFIEIDTLEVFHHRTAGETTGEAAVPYLQSVDRPAAFCVPQDLEAQHPPRLEKPGKSQIDLQVVAEPYLRSSHDSPLLSEPGRFPMDLHKTYGKVLESIEALQGNRRLDLNSERQLRMSKAYFHLMEAFSNFLFQAFDLDGGMPRHFEAFPDLSSALPQELFRMIEMSKGESFSINNVADHSLNEMLCKPQEQRRAQRLSLSLPMQVYSKDRGWREQTESLDVSPLGVKFPLTHYVEPGMRLQLEMPMPENLRIYKASQEAYEVEAYVCRILSANDGTLLVGAEFGAIL
jgi:tetratricopeptide (TPR) repeat protein